MRKSALDFFYKMKKVIFILFFLPFSISAQSWYPMNVGVTNSFGNAVVSGITDYQGTITIGGYFKKSGTNTLNGVAQWSGTQWEGMGLGFWITAIPDSVGNGGFGMATYNSKLYCSGIFEGAGGTFITDPMHQANAIAKWDVSDWFPMTQPNDGVNNSCTALQVYNGNLYLGGFYGGSFDSSGVVGTQGISKWNDTVFSAIGQLSGNFPPYSYFAVLDFTVYNNKLIAAGYFNSIDGSPYGSYGFIAAWNDTAWSALGTGLSAPVAALTVFNGDLYAGGFFTTTGDAVSANHIAKWDGIQWLPVGEGLNDTVITLCVDSLHNKLIAGGKFTQTGLGVPAKHIAEWNGTNWQEIGGGANADVWAVFAKDSNLYVGGSFTQVGGVPANLIAVWGNSPVGINEADLQNEELKIYPNPTTSEITIEFELSETKNTFIVIKNILGQTIRILSNNVFFKGNNKIEVDLSELSCGLYFVQLQRDNKITCKKIIKE